MGNRQIRGGEIIKWLALLRRCDVHERVETPNFDILEQLLPFTGDSAQLSVQPLVDKLEHVHGNAGAPAACVLDMKWWPGLHNADGDFRMVGEPLVLFVAERKLAGRLGLLRRQPAGLKL